MPETVWAMECSGIHITAAPCAESSWRFALMIFQLKPPMIFQKFGRCGLLLLLRQVLNACPGLYDAISSWGGYFMGLTHCPFWRTVSDLGM